jgi:molybdate transport system substrate-binding protein
MTAGIPGRAGPLRALAAVLITAPALTLAACGSSGSSGSRSGASSPPFTAPSTTTTEAPVSGTLTVFAAASLTGAFDAAETALGRADPGLRLDYNFAGSNTLVAQIEQGAPADVFASADTRNMDRLVAAGLVETPVMFARNRLEIAVARGNPKHVHGLADLARPGVSVVLEAAGVPAGDYTRSVLASQHITVHPVSLETDVKSALAKVTSGEADATVVYVTDVTAAGSAVTGVTVPTSLQPDISYPIAVVKATRNHAAARAFIESAVGGDVQKALEAAGFLPPR